MKKDYSEPKIILFVHNNNDLYGAESILLELVKRLDRRSFYPIVVLPTDTRHINRLSPRLEQEGIEYHFIRMAVMRRKYFHLLGALRYVRDLVLGSLSLVGLIRRRHVALVHSNTIAVLCGAVAAWITRRPHVWHIHEIIVDPKPARRMMHSLVCHLSDAVIAISGAVRGHILRDCPSCAERFQVIHNGIDVAPLSREPGNAKIREEFGVPLNSPLVGMAGRVCRWKGQLLFLEAAKLASQAKPELYFIAVGGVFDDDVAYMERFRNAADRSGLEGRFIVSDFRSDIREVMNSFDIFVLPSTQPEPFGLVVLEAMALAKPVIASAHGGPMETVCHGETGYLIPPNDSRALADSILKLADDPLHAVSMGAVGCRRVSERFRAERFVSDFQRLYSALLNQEQIPEIVESPTPSL
jgi:glycosyltransferase involved in cell wall biosynthesis